MGDDIKDLEVHHSFQRRTNFLLWLIGGFAIVWGIGGLVAKGALGERFSAAAFGKTLLATIFVLIACALYRCLLRPPCPQCGNPMDSKEKASIGETLWRAVECSRCGKRLRVWGAEFTLIKWLKRKFGD